MVIRLPKLPYSEKQNDSGYTNQNLMINWKAGKLEKILWHHKEIWLKKYKGDKTLAENKLNKRLSVFSCIVEGRPIYGTRNSEKREANIKTI
jgi:hypothetical protein